MPVTWWRLAEIAQASRSFASTYGGGNKDFIEAESFVVALRAEFLKEDETARHNLAKARSWLKRRARRSGASRSSIQPSGFGFRAFIGMAWFGGAGESPDPFEAARRAVANRDENSRRFFEAYTK